MPNSPPNSNSPPNIDQRDATQVAQQVRSRLSQSFPTWHEAQNPATGQPQGLSAALITIFARYSEVLIQRLNQVPQKNFLAFLNLLGASRLPPQPARVPLTFFLAAGSTVEGVVPARTQVAAPPAEGEKDPVMFETERELVVTAAKLESVYVRNPETDLVGDYSAIAIAESAQDRLAFQGNRSIEHILYIANDAILSYANLKALRLNIVAALLPDPHDSWQVQWEYWDGAQFVAIAPTADSSANLSQTGAIIFGTESISDNPNTSKNLPEFAAYTVNQIEKRWLRCRLVTPINGTGRSQIGMVRADQLPTLTGLFLQPTLQESNVLIDQAFTNQVPLDLSKDFFPFGEQPKLGDAFLLASQTLFSKPRARITLTFALTPADNQIKTPVASDNIQLTWEYWNGKAWIAFGISTRTSGTPVPKGAELFEDTTQAFTQGNSDRNLKAGKVQFTLPNDAASTTVNGLDNYWIRVRITQGNYGIDSQYLPATIKVGDTTLNTFTFQPANFNPPLIQKLIASYQMNPLAAPPPENLPEAVLACNDGTYTTVTPRSSENARVPVPAFLPFQKTAAAYPSLYFGFTLPLGRSQFPNRPITLFCRTADVAYGDRPVPLSPLYSRRPKTDLPVQHRFVITNATAQPVTYQLNLFGHTWVTTWVGDVGNTVTIPANSQRQMILQVTVPITATPIDRDRGFLQLTPLPPLSNITADIAIVPFETLANRELPPVDQPQLQWEYWNGQAWQKLTVRDESENFTRTGLIEFLPPADFALKPPDRSEFGLGDRYWIRVQWQRGQYKNLPQIRRLLLNTTIATQTVTLSNEILGSSDGTEHQRFRTTRSPVLDGAQLQVRELELPALPEQARIREQEGSDSITATRQPNGQLQEVWVRWHEVPDFYGSGPRDRHYLLDHLTGEIQFGNGINGMIPPIQVSNIRMGRYYTGGGEQGNRAAGAIVQLKTTVPYIDAVINPEPATGGAEAETLESLRDRAPRTIRHGNRAVTPADYEDLAMLASPAVARVKSVPLKDLSHDEFVNVPNGTLPNGSPPSPNPAALSIQGDISLIIVPQSTALKPLPSIELIQEVQDYLEAHAPVSATITVVGPPYVRVSVTVDIALQSLEGASAVEQAVYQTLTRFLHPLTGGFDGNGWTFGRKPHKSDFYALLEAIPGVDHIHALTIDPDRNPTPEVQQILNTNRFLVYSGNHQVTLRSE